MRSPGRSKKGSANSEASPIIITTTAPKCSDPSANLNVVATTASQVSGNPPDNPGRTMSSSAPHPIQMRNAFRSSSFSLDEDFRVLLVGGREVPCLIRSASRRVPEHRMQRPPVFAPVSGSIMIPQQLQGIRAVSLMTSNVRHERQFPACRKFSARWRGWASCFADSLAFVCGHPPCISRCVQEPALSLLIRLVFNWRQHLAAELDCACENSVDFFHVDVHRGLPRFDFGR